ncbi:arginine kinase isoform X3 [Nematostella vectensis]|nr:arginine kinase isoform X3 [Nematostella vectensis]
MEAERCCKENKYPDILQSSKANPNCLLRKYLTKELFEELKEKKSSSGVTLWDCIKSGVVNLDSGTGVYVADEECYQLFAPLLDKIIEDYHAPYKLSDGHKSDMNPEAVDAPNLDPDNDFIRSTRIRVARNLKGYRLTPALEQDKRIELESKIKDVLESLEGDLKGKYYPLSGMDEATRQQLVDDHFLFKKGDRFLEAAGVNREWPEGRGIFHNNDKTFLVWVNEEDQLRIISMEMGSDIGSVFRRLCTAVNELDNKLGFQQLPGHGYLSSCPTNLGTGMRASVHVKIPHASAHPDFQKICDEFHIQARGIHGEHSVSTGADAGVFDISNKRRLGLSEVQCVQDMYNGVKKLLEIEKAAVEAKRNVFPEVLKKPEVKSLMKKYLTEEMFNELKDKKTELGVTLSDCINSGVENLDSGTGIYAGDEESYKLFAPLFDKIIEDYHAPYKLEQKHTSDMNPEKVEAPDLDPEGSFIRSTRIRVARNLKGYALTPALSKKARLEIEEKVKNVFESLTGDLAGKYHPLDGMTEETRQQLVNDHFLFKKGDRFLEAAGVNKLWPEGRGIFHNNDKTFLVWVNEEDQLRIISMEMGSDIGSVFKRLCTAVNEIDKQLGFQHTEEHGYLSSCPTNLGTGMRASVHVKIPHASAHPDFQKICDEFHIQARGIHGEHSVSTGADAGVFDISNKRRLGLSEVQCVQDMYNGVKKLLEIERAAIEEAHLNFPEDLKKPEVKSLLKKYLTEDVFNSLKEKKTSRGAGLYDCINSGVVNLDSGTGVYAADEECYEVFGELFDKIIEDYHAPYKLEENHKSDMDPEKVDAPNLDAEGAFIRSTRIRVARNLKGYALTPGLTRKERVDVESKVVGVLNSLTGDLAGKYYPLSGMDEATRQQLVDDHFLFKKGDRFLEAAGVNKMWPEGRGIFHNNDKTFLVWVNEEDQLRIISMEMGSDIGSVFSRLCRAVNEIDKQLGFAHKETHGYLSGCPTNLGTGMRASVHVKIPKASEHPDFQKICDEFHIQARGIHGEHSVSTGEDAGVFDISNKRRLGLSEVQCVQDMYNGVKKLLEIEKA